MDKTTIKLMRRASREAAQKRAAVIGQPKSKTWGGKPSNRAERREAKKALRKME